MSFFLSPTGNDVIDDFTPTPASASAFSVVDDDRYVPDDGDFLLGDAAISGTVTFSYTFPANYTVRSYGDGTVPVNLPIINSITMHLRMARNAAGTSTVQPTCTRLGASNFLSLGVNLSLTSVSPTFTNFSVVSTLDPHTNAAWTPANAVNTAFGITVTGLAGLPNTILARTFLEIVDAYGVGSTRARLGPNRQEPSFFCAVCSVPFHLSDLIRPEHPLHPHYGRYVCKDDFDSTIPIEEEGLRGTSLIEGDIDFDVP